MAAPRVRVTKDNSDYLYELQKSEGCPFARFADILGFAAAYAAHRGKTPSHIKSSELGNKPEPMELHLFGAGDNSDNFFKVNLVTLLGVYGDRNFDSFKSNSDDHGLEHRVKNFESLANQGLELLQAAIKAGTYMPLVEIFENLCMEAINSENAPVQNTADLV